MAIFQSFKSLKRNILMTTIGFSGLLTYPTFGASNEAILDKLSQTKVLYSITHNQAYDNGVNCMELGADWASCYQSVISLTPTVDVDSKVPWVIYFHNIRQILRVDDEQFNITHVTGDLYRLEPNEHFKGFKANQTINIPIVTEYWVLFQTDFIPNWYVTLPGLQPKVLKSTNTEDISKFSEPLSFASNLWKRTALDHNVFMTVENRFLRNDPHEGEATEKLPATALRGKLIPTPFQTILKAENIDLSKGISVIFPDGFSQESVKVIQTSLEKRGVSVNTSGQDKIGFYRVESKIDSDAVKKALTSSLKNVVLNGAYLLSIKQDKAELIAYDPAGLFYGLQSIDSLIFSDEKNASRLSLPSLEIKDAPRFEYRGMFLDVARNFHSKEAVLRLLDTMARYKMNKFHFHLSDDEGWRIEIKDLPELTEVGSKRCHDLTEQKCLLPQLGSGPDQNNMGSGYFSRKDYIDILTYAKNRYIEVIPEIDVPAHARAAIISMEARYNNLMAQGKQKEAEEYRLVDPTDTSNTTSVQFYDRRSYLNPCLSSSKTFIEKVIKEIADVHKEVGMPLNVWHFGGDEAKNIRLGAGYQDKKSKVIVAGKGMIDQSNEDLPWQKSKVCEALVKKGVVKDLSHLPSYFALEVSGIIASQGIDTMQAWQDGLKYATSAKSFKTNNVAVNFWETLYWDGANIASDWASKGYKVINSNPDYVYLDMPNEVNSKESGYYWATRFSDQLKVFSFAPNNMPQNAETSVDRDGDHFTASSEKEWLGSYGMSGFLWSEVVRTDDQMEYMIYPRLLSIAERAWHRADWELDYQKGRTFIGGKTNFVDQEKLFKDWEIFANLLGQKELIKLDQAKIQYRVPLPGARILNDVLEANVALPGLTVQYSINGGDWAEYSKPVKLSDGDVVKLRTVSADGKRFSREETIKNVNF